MISKAERGREGGRDSGRGRGGGGGREGQGGGGGREKGGRERQREGVLLTVLLIIISLNWSPLKHKMKMLSLVTNCYPKP